MNIAIDASVSLKWFLTFETAEANVAEAPAVLRAVGTGRSKVIQPPHWRGEVAAVIARLRSDFAKQAVEFLYQLDCKIDMS